MRVCARNPQPGGSHPGSVEVPLAGHPAGRAAGEAVSPEAYLILFWCHGRPMGHGGPMGRGRRHKVSPFFAPAAQSGTLFFNPIAVNWTLGRTETRKRVSGFPLGLNSDAQHRIFRTHPILKVEPPRSRTHPRSRTQNIPKRRSGTPAASHPRSRTNPKSRTRCGRVLGRSRGPPGPRDPGPRAKGPGHLGQGTRAPGPRGPGPRAKGPRAKGPQGVPRGPKGCLLYTSPSPRD